MARRIHCTIAPGLPVPLLYVDDGGCYGGIFDAPTRVTFALCDDDHPGWGSTIQFGASSLRYVTPVAPGDYEGPLLVPAVPVGPGPVGPSRAAVCQVQLTFQGLTVQTQQYGSLPWFEPALVCLTAADRQQVYAAKRAAGDTHLIVECFSASRPLYDEPGQPYQSMIVPNCEAVMPWFVALVGEITGAGFTPIVVFDGDNADNEPFGSANAVRQLPILVSALSTLNDRILYARFWDGVFYGSSPAHIAAFGRAFRQLLPQGHLAIEHQPGRIPVGGGPGDYDPGGAMSTYDVICSEYDETLQQDSTWQVAARMLGPAYRRPSEQPAGDDPTPPWYLAPGTPRGPYFTCALEWVGEYLWVRGRTTTATCAAQRGYLKSLGYEWTG